MEKGRYTVEATLTIKINKAAAENPCFDVENFVNGVADVVRSHRRAKKFIIHTHIC